MSVAFRRESDDEHLEPRFEIPIAPGPNVVTPRGLRQIEAKLAHFDLAIAATDDAEAIKALRRDHRYWGTRLSSAVVAPAPPEDGVAIGSRVTFRLDGAVRTIDIVGGDEADGESRIAFAAPLARAMIGAEVGECVDFGGREDAIEILETQAAPDDK